MSTLGRFAEFQVSPQPEDRLGGFKTGATAIAQLAPVRRPTATTTKDPIDGLIAVELAAANSGPKLGETGLCVYEQLPELYNIQRNVAPITQISDLVDAPPRRAIQVVHGTYVEVVFRNLSADDLLFEGIGEYEGRNMVNPTDLQTLAIGNLLTPGAGNSDDGFWKKTSDAAEAWLRVIDVDASVGMVAATVLF